MIRLTCLAMIAVLGMGAGLVGAVDKPLDQSTIVSVRPAIPDGAKAFVAQQDKLEQERHKKPLFGGLFQKKDSQSAVAGYTPPPSAKPASGGSFWDIFNPAKWGKGKQAASPSPQQVQQMQQQNQQATWTQQGAAQPPAWNQPASGQPGFGQQMPAGNTFAPASQPG